MRYSMRTATYATAVFVLLALAGAGLAVQDEADATLELQATQVSVGIGWSWGGGTLSYKGKQHRFTLDGLVVNAVGGSASDATGYVYNLHSLQEFAGTYVAAEASGSAGGGRGITTMKNEHGVRITLHSSHKGIEAVAGPEGVKIALK